MCPAAAERLRRGGGLRRPPFSVEIQANNEDYLRQFKAVCRLGRVSAVPLITTAAASADSSIEAEVKPPDALDRLWPARKAFSSRWRRASGR